MAGVHNATPMVVAFHTFFCGCYFQWRIFDFPFFSPFSFGEPHGAVGLKITT